MYLSTAVRRKRKSFLSEVSHKSVEVLCDLVM